MRPAKARKLGKGASAARFGIHVIATNGVKLHISG